MKFSIKDLVTFTEKIFNGKLHFFVQCHSVLRLNKKLGRGEAFAGILIDFSKQKLDIIKLSNLNKNL